MELFEAIHGRRSIRRYRSEPVSEADLEQLIRAACAAPSAGNQQPWRFVVVDDPKLLKGVPEFHPYSYMVPEAPVAVVVCADLTLVTHEGYWVQDCAAATQNMLLGAHALGLGAVWLGVYPRESRVDGLRKLLSLPEHVVPFAIVALGHPDEKKPPIDRFDPSRVHRNGW
ncbi:MAG: nitroreductase family protein [Thermoleophilia bacterium]